MTTLWQHLRARIEEPIDTIDLGRERRVSLAVVALATVWMLIVAGYGLAGPVLDGHDAAMAAIGIITDNMQRWGIAAPVWTYTSEPPAPASYYCHHPWGIFWTTWLFRALLGRHDFVLRLPAVLLSTATVPLVAALARAWFRPYAGAMAALGFVSLPIALSFAGFNALEVPVMAYGTLFLWGAAELARTGRRRYLFASVVGAVLAVHADWPAYVLVGGTLTLSLAARLVDRRPWPSVVRTWWLATCALTTASLALYLVLFARAGQLGELWRVYGARSSGNHAPLHEVLAGRRYWIELMFSPLAIGLGKIAAIVCVGRWVVLRRVREAGPLVVLLMAVVQYVVFKQGADVHVFWPHYFALFFALGLAATFATAASLLRNRLGAQRAGLVGLGLGALLLVPVLRDGAASVPYARATGGRFDERGARIASGAEKVALLRELAAHDGAPSIGLHPSFTPTWAHAWALGGRPVSFAATTPAAGSGDLIVADARFVADSVKAGWLSTHEVTTVGPFWLVRGAPAISFARRFAETEPNAWSRYWTNTSEPLRTLEDDAYAAWELRAHYGLAEASNAAPTSQPRTPEQLRIAHNIAREARDDAAAAKAWQAAAEGCRPLGITLPNGIRLLCARVDEGVSPRLTVLYDLTRPLRAAETWVIRGRVTTPPAFSTTMADPSVRLVSFPSALASTRLRLGFLYATQVDARARPGKEIFEATSVDARGEEQGTPVSLVTRR